MPTPDPGIKRVVIPQQTLGEISDSGEYFVRYRIVSEDEVVTSEWSPKYKFIAKTVQEIIGFNPSGISYQIFADGTSMSLSWATPTEIKDSKFDVFVDWDYSGSDDGNFQYAGTVSTNSINIDVPTSPRPAEAIFHVQLASTEKASPSSNSKIKLFETAPHTTYSIINGGTP